MSKQAYNLKNSLISRKNRIKTIFAEINKGLKMDYLKINKKFWNKWSKERGPWSQRYPKEQIQKAMSGKVELGRNVPENWFPKNWKGLDVLGLAAAGGQQMPLIAAAGASVTSFDFSKEQLKRDLEVCEEEGLKIKTQKGEMGDLSVFPDESFDFVLNPASTCFTKNVRKVYKEVFRVLRPSGIFITTFLNPVFYSINDGYDEKKSLRLVNSIPYSDIKSLSKKEIQKTIKDLDSLEFGHSLIDLIGGQTKLGFKITGFYEYKWKDLGKGKGFAKRIDSIMPSFISTKAIK